MDSSYPISFVKIDSLTLDELSTGVSKNLLAANLSYAVDLCKDLGSRSDPTECTPDLDQSCLTH